MISPDGLLNIISEFCHDRNFRFLTNFDIVYFEFVFAETSRLIGCPISSLIFLSTNVWEVVSFMVFLYDLDLWPQPWPWPWTFKVKFWNSCLSGLDGPIDWKQKKIWINRMMLTLDFNLTRDLDLGFSMVRLSIWFILEMSDPIDIEQKGYEYWTHKRTLTIWCWTHYMTLILFTCPRP